MTTLENRPNTALLVIDVQNNAVERAHDREAVVANVAGLVSGLGVGRLIVVGAQIDWCVRSTLHGTEDQTEWGAPPPEQVIAHTSLLWSYRRRRAGSPGRWAPRTSTSPPVLTPADGVAPTQPPGRGRLLLGGPGPAGSGATPPREPAG
jgi:hypothetical protein